MARVLFFEDKPMIGVQQPLIETRGFSGRERAMLLDKAAVLARRTFERLAALEAGEAR